MKSRALSLAFVVSGLFVACAATETLGVVPPDPPPSTVITEGDAAANDSATVDTGIDLPSTGSCGDGKVTAGALRRPTFVSGQERRDRFGDRMLLVGRHHADGHPGVRW